MSDLTDLSNALAQLPIGTLLAFIILAGFGLAAYAIYAVLSVTKDR